MERHPEHDTIKSMFAGVPVEPDTRLTGLRYGYVGSLPARLEKWNFEGVRGKTVVLRAQDVADQSDEEVVGLVRDAQSAEGQITIKRTGEFVFVNHSFWF